MSCHLLLHTEGYAIQSLLVAGATMRGLTLLMHARCAGLLQKKAQDGTQTTMEATLMAQQTPQQREQVPCRPNEAA